MLDISQPNTLINYLVNERHIFADHNLTIKYFDGGVSCVVALASDGHTAILIKQALAKLKVKADWQCDPRRILIEKNANEIYHQILPEKVPRVHFYDAASHIFVRQAVPEDHTMWKTQLLSGNLNPSIATQAIDALSQIHRQTAGNPKIAQQFADKTFFNDLRIDAYLRATALRHPDHKTTLYALAATLLQTSLVLVHGDFSPKNILVKNDTLQILDFEVAHYGHPAFDLAFFSTHFLLKSIKNRQTADAYLDLLTSMLQKYFSSIDLMDPVALEQTTALLTGALLLARVDGKSPAEYITEDADKKLIRHAASQILSARPGSCRQMIGILHSHILNTQNSA